jgi:hypothetical protein
MVLALASVMLREKLGLNVVDFVSGYDQLLPLHEQNQWMDSFLITL